MKNDFEQRKERKISRYQELANKNETNSELLFKRASELASVIPFGQPILVGHHSESRDRNFRAKINRVQDKAMHASSKAQYYADKAAIAESNNAISSDDPRAIEKLTEKMEAMLQLQELMKAANKIIKNKKLTDLQKIEKLGEHNIKENHAAQLLLPDFCKRVGFPDYRLTNNNANINRIKKRIESLTKINEMETTEIQINNVRILTNVEGNRVQLFFQGKPSLTTREHLKRNGFRWSPSEGAWQRQISNSAIWSAKDIASKLDNETPVNSNDEPEENYDNGPTGHGDDCFSDADEGL